MSAESPAPPPRRRCCRVPLVVDLVFEDYRSRLIGFITALRPLLALVVGVGAGVLSLPASCLMAAAPVPASEGTTASSILLLMLFYVLAALAAHRSHSRRLLLPALLAGIAYFSLQATTELPACSRAGAPVRVALSIADSLFSLITIGCLAWLVVDDPRAALGAPPSKAELFEARMPTALAALAARDAALGSADGALGSADGAGAGDVGASSLRPWVRDVRRGALVAPLRHHLAVLLTLVCVLWVPAALTLYMLHTVALSAPVGSPMEPLFIALSDALLAATVGSWLASAHIVFACVSSYAALYNDARVVVASRGDAAGKEGSPPAAGAAATAAGGDGASQPGGLPGGGAFAWLTPRGPSPFVNGDESGLLDVGGAAFSYHSASTYAVLFVFTQLTCFALATVLLSALVFFVASRATRSQAIEAAVAVGVSALWKWLVRRAYSRWLARGVTILHPRFFAFIDFWLAMSFGAAAGVTAGAVRFVLGVATVLARMTVLSRPILPVAYAAFDGGFLAYGGMLRTALATELDAANVPAKDEPPAPPAAPGTPPPPPAAPWTATQAAPGAPQPAAPWTATPPPAAPWTASTRSDAAGAAPVAAASVVAVDASGVVPRVDINNFV